MDIGSPPQFLAYCTIENTAMNICLKSCVEVCFHLPWAVTRSRIASLYCAFMLIYIFYPHSRTYSLIFRERGREGKREGEKLYGRGTLIGCLSYAPQLGTEPAT